MTDITRTGSREYTPEEYQRVVEFIASAPGALGNDDISRILGIGGRTLRAIISDADGIEWVVSIGDSGISLAGSAEDADAGTRRLVSQATAMLERAQRRRQWADANLTRVQPFLPLV